MSRATTGFASVLAFALVTPGMAAPTRAKSSHGAGGVACEAVLAEAEAERRTGQPLKLKVAGREVVLGEAEGPPESLRVYPADASSVLVAVAYAGSGGWDPRGSDTLWRVPCAAGTSPTSVAHVAGADFAHSALARDGRRLFYSGEDGIFALDLRTGKSRRVTKAAFPSCSQNDFTARDVVGDLDASGALLFERGCHYEWEWHGQSMRLRRAESRKPVVEAAPRPPLPAVAIDASGGIWLSDGWCGDRSTYQRLLHSTDRGKHWRVVPFKRSGQIPTEQAIRQIVPDATNPLLLLVFTRTCVENDQYTEPSWVYVTEDAGATFRPIGVPPGIPAVDGHPSLFNRDPLCAIVAQHGSLSDLILFGFGENTETGMGEGVARWMSRDLGRTWKPIPSAKMTFNECPRPQPFATHGNWRVAIEPDGLYLSQPDKPRPVLIYRRR